MKRLLFYFLSIFLFFHFSNSLAQQPDFSIYKLEEEGSTPICGAWADFDGDGKSDYAKSATSSKLVIFTNKGSFQFSSAVSSGIANLTAIVPFKYASYSTSYELFGVDKSGNKLYIVRVGGSSFSWTSKGVGTSPVALDTADFNQDGFIDVVTANKGSNNVSLIMSTAYASFGNATQIPAGQEPAGITTGNFNNDNYPDFAVINALDNTLGVYMGNGDGTFSTPQIFLVDNYAYYITSSDFNGDGKDDVVISHYQDNGSGNPGKINIVMNDGSGSFSIIQHFDIPNFTPYLLCEDIDEDNITDIVFLQTSASFSIIKGTGTGFENPVTHKFGVRSFYGVSIHAADLNNDNVKDLVLGSGNLYMIKGKSAGSFYLPTFSNPESRMTEYENGDFNNDGKLDVFFCLNDSVGICLGNGDGSFGHPETYVIPDIPNYNNFGQEVTTSDVNNDGFLDAIVGTDDFHNPCYIYVYLGDGTGAISLSVSRYVGSEIRDMKAADFNNDGNQDLIILHGYDKNHPGGNVSVLLGNGNGSFQTAVKSVAGNFPHRVEIIDFDKDGIQDVIIVNSESSASYSYYTTALKGNGDGSFSLKSILSTSGDTPQDVGVGDLNMDGNPDVVLSCYERITSFLGDGSGTFTQAQQILRRNDYFTELELNDFNGDNFPDAAVTIVSTSSIEGTRRILLFTGYGDGGFASPLNVQTSEYTYYGRDIKSGDYTSDGKIDLLLNPDDDYHLALLENISSLNTLEPNISSSDIFFTNVTEQSITVNWSNGNGEKRIVICRAGQPVSKKPLDGFEYAADYRFTAGEDLGDGSRAIYAGTGNSVNVTILNPNVVYYFAVFEYNGKDDEINYLTSVFLSGSQQTNQVLFTSPLPKSEYCKGELVSVAFTTSIAYTSSFNRFRVYLSDASGTFNTKTLLAQSTTSPINCVIPPNIVSGSSYRLRVEASNPSTIGDDNGTDITIYDTPLKNLMVSAENTCYGQDAIVTISGSETGIVYQAFINSNPVGTATNGNGSDLNITIPSASLSSGNNTVLVSASNPNCSVNLINTAQMTKEAEPILTYSVTGEVVCPGSTSSVVLSGSESSVSYQLYSNSSALGTSTPGNGGYLSIQISSEDLSPGNNVVQVLAFRNSCNPISLNDTAHIFQLSINKNVPNSIVNTCYGEDSEVSIDNSEMNVLYEVFCNNVFAGSIMGNGSQITIPISSGLLNLGDNFIDLKATLTGCSSGEFIFVDHVLGLNACTGINKPTVSVNSLVYPNPARSSIMVNATYLHFSYYDLKIKSILGEVIFEKNNCSVSSLEEVDISNLKSGNYIIEFYNDDKIFTTKLVVQN